MGKARSGKGYRRASLGRVKKGNDHNKKSEDQSLKEMLDSISFKQHR